MTAPALLFEVKGEPKCASVYWQSLSALVADFRDEILSVREVCERFLWPYSSMFWGKANYLAHHISADDTPISLNWQERQ